MVRAVYASVLMACLALAACSAPQFNEPIRLPANGAAVRANMAAHIIDPIPPAPAPRISDANRAVIATESYRTNDVDKTTGENGESLTGAAE